jgi:hypothetical protein
MPFDGTGFEQPRRRPEHGPPAARLVLREALTWIVSFSMIWLPFLAAVIWVEVG